MVKFTNAQQFNTELQEWGHKVALPEFAKIVRIVTLSALRHVVKLSPVDTGRFRGNWQVARGGDPTGTVESTAGLGGTLAKASAVVAGALPFEPLVIGNNMPQLEPIDLGQFKPPNPENSPEANARRAARRRSRNKRATRALAAALGDPGAPLVQDGYTRKAPQGVIGPAVEILRQEFPFIEVIHE